MAQLSEMLVFLRKREGLSQQELAEKLKISRSSIGMYETGKREPDLETLEIFADFYNVNMDTLTGRSEPSGGLSPEGLEFARKFDVAKPELKAIIKRVLDGESKAEQKFENVSVVCRLDQRNKTICQPYTLAEGKAIPALNGGCEDYHPCDQCEACRLQVMSRFLGE